MSRVKVHLTEDQKRKKNSEAAKRSRIKRKHREQRIKIVHNFTKIKKELEKDLYLYEFAANEAKNLLYKINARKNE
ncbi:hypothetical protein HZS_7633 [Henneguya salminicola]|nr:hypothetical protein HZS_7633 [Henneguya salminicola]